MSTRLACIVLSSSLLFACGDDGDEVLPDATLPGADATIVVADAAAIDAPVPDATVSDARVNDASPPDASVTPDAMSCGTTCPTPNASTTANVVNTGGIIFESIDIATSRITLKNVTAGAKTITGWFLCFGFGQYAQIPTASPVTVPDGGTLTLVYGSGPCGGVQAGEVCVPGSSPPSVPAADELGLYIDQNYGMPASIRAYVRWGTSDATGSDRQGVAATAGLWPATTAANDFVPICATDDGLIASIYRDGLLCSAYEPSTFYDGNRRRALRPFGRPHQFHNLWDDPSRRSLKSDLVADLYANLPPASRAPSALAGRGVGVREQTIKRPVGFAPPTCCR